MDKIKCKNCDSYEVREQVIARGIFVREPNAAPYKVDVVSWEPKHDFYECIECGNRW